jgi:hypothetical protein
MHPEIGCVNRLFSNVKQCFYIGKGGTIMLMTMTHDSNTLVLDLATLGKATEIDTSTSKNIDCLMARTACLVCFISTVNGRNNKKRKEKKRKEEAYPWKTCTSSRHITNLKQSILETFDIYG